MAGVRDFPVASDDPTLQTQPPKPKLPPPSSDEGAVGSTSYGGGGSVTKLEGSVPKGGWDKGSKGVFGDIGGLMALMGGLGGFGQAGPRFGGQAGPRTNSGMPYASPVWQAGGICGTPEKRMSNQACWPRGEKPQDSDEMEAYAAPRMMGMSGGNPFAALLSRIAGAR